MVTGEVDPGLVAILDAMIDGVVLLDAQGRVQRTNLAMGRLLGGEAGWLTGKGLGDIVADGDREFAAQLVEGCLDGAFRHRDTHFRRATGELVSMALSGSPLRDAAGEPAGWVLVVRDDRELKQTQAQLQLSDRLTTMGVLAAGVAHEINNPLSFVVANLAFVHDELSALQTNGEIPPGERIAEVLRALQASRGGADRVRNIVRDLHRFSRPAGDVVDRTDVTAVAESAVALVEGEVRRHARIVRQYGRAPEVMANEGRLAQVFLNLLQNAAQAIPRGSGEAHRIIVSTGTDGDGNAFIEVHDTGCGIPPENLARIFEPFFTTKPIGVGTGLGLPICQRIVSSMGGRIELKSEVGVGSVFRVVVPAAPPASSSRGPVTPSGPPSSRGRGSR